MIEVVADALGGFLLAIGVLAMVGAVLDHLRSGTKKAVTRLPWRARRRMERTRRAHNEAKAALENAYKYKADRRIEERQAWRNEFEELLRPLYPEPKTERVPSGPSRWVATTNNGLGYLEYPYDTVHMKNCECFECSKDALINKPSQGGTIK